MKIKFRFAVRIAGMIGLIVALAMSAASWSVLAQQRNARATLPQPSGIVGADQLVINTDLITLTVSVTDKTGQYVSGLDKSAFAVFDDQVLQDIRFFSDEDVPVSVSVVFDVSGSMSGNKILQAREALSRFIQTSHERDEYFLLSFDAHVYDLLDKTRDAASVLAKFTYVQPHGNTALYDAVYLGLDKLARGAYPKRVILLISDGEDNRSRYTFKELRRALQESGTLVYSIGIGVRYLRHATGEETLKELASISGGKAFFPTSADKMHEVFERIALELRHQYSIGYRPKIFVPDGRWHRLKVKLTPPPGLPRLVVRSRKGYYATANQLGR